MILVLVIVALFLFVVSLFAGYLFAVFCCFVLKRMLDRFAEPWLSVLLRRNLSSTKIENFPIRCCFFLIFMQKKACKRLIYVNSLFF